MIITIFAASVLAEDKKPKIQKVPDDFPNPIPPVVVDDSESPNTSGMMFCIKGFQP
jgi:hypothetical protein